MTTAYDLPDAIQWHEGMLLSPQHFQQAALRNEILLDYQLSMTAAYHWGVHELEIDDHLLMEGIFRVIGLQAVMPDNLVVCVRSSTEAPLETDLTAHADAMKEGPVTVHLAVPTRKSGEDIAKGALARFRSTEGEPVADENTGDAPLRIPRLIPRLSLIVGDAPPQKYCTFPIARVAYLDETYQRTDYLPPVLQVERRSPIGRMCADMARRLREKAVFLSERLRSPAAVMRGPMLMGTKAMIGGLVTAVPAFEALIQSDRTHPFTLYLALCRIAGQVSALGGSMIPPIFPPFDHDDLRASFDRVVTYIGKTIEEGILETHSAVPFELKAGAFRLRMDAKWLSEDHIVGVKVRSGGAEQEVHAWMSDALIGSEPVMASLKTKRILGAERFPIEGSEDLIPVRGVYLYSIKNESEFIVPGAELVIENLTEARHRARPSDIVLYVRN